MAFNFNYPNGSPQDRGWGPGWQPGMSIGVRPIAYPGRIVQLEGFVGGIREELEALASMLVNESIARGYIPRLDDPGCWGGAFRPTKRSDGSYTTTPSNHSWYTALDVNAPHNVYGSSTHQIPQAMANMWKQYGWRWLGPPIKDWMHFDFAGSPADAKRMTEKARKEIGGTDVTGDDLLKGVAAWLKGDPIPTAEGPARKIYRALEKAAEQRAGGSLPPHDHPHEHSHKHALGNSGLEVPVP